jgi:hypothetical protein
MRMRWKISPCSSAAWYATPSRSLQVWEHRSSHRAQLMAIYAGVPNGTINGLCFSYTVTRIAFAIAYILVGSERWSYVRSFCWYVGNICCTTLVLLAGKRLNA